MSVKQGSNFIAGNLAIKLQDRIFTASEVMEGDQEYYDLTIPVGATLGFAEATRLMLLIRGTNKTSTPILRVVGRSDKFFIVTNYTNKNTLAPGMLVDGLIMDFYILNLTETKPNTNIKYIYLGNGGENYNYPSVANPPYFTGKDPQDIRPLVSGPNSFVDLGLPYREGNNYNFGDIALIELQPDKAIYKGVNLQFGENATDTYTFVGQKPTWNSQKLATEKDLADLAIGDQYVDMLVYARETITQMEAITDAVVGNTCLVIENKTIYQKAETSWAVNEVLDYNLTTDNGKYFIVEDVDGDHSGRVIWNIADGGEFKIFIDYSNSIDNNTLVRNPISRDVEVAKVPNKLTIKYGEVSNTFDGSTALSIVLPEYYSKEDTDSQYNSLPVDKLLTLVKEGTNNKISTVDVDATKLVTLQNYLSSNNINVTPDNIYYDIPLDMWIPDNTLGSYLKYATVVSSSTGLLTYPSMADGKEGAKVEPFNIYYTDGRFPDVTNLQEFFNKNFVFTEIENNFTGPQYIDGSQIATQGWLESEFLPNKFNFDILSNLEVQTNSPSLGNLALRLSYKPLGEDAISSKDVPLPLATATMAGLMSKEQFSKLTNLDSNYVPVEVTAPLGKSKIEQGGNYLNITESQTDGSFAQVQLINGVLSLGAFKSDKYSQIVLRQDGGYYVENSLVYDDAHKMINKGYVDNKFLPLNNIVKITELNTHWEGKRVALNGFDFTSVTGSSATYTLYGSDIESGTEVTHAHEFPIVTETTAGLATASMYNQLDDNTAAIANLQGQGYVGAELPENPTSEQVEAAWSAAKPTIPSIEGSSLLDLRTGNTWRKLNVDGTLVWNNLGVLGGTGQATNATTGVVKGSASGAGTIFVENDATMNVNGWDELTSNVANLDLDITTVSTNLENHIANTVLHISSEERQKWDTAALIADAIGDTYLKIPTEEGGSGLPIVVYNSHLKKTYLGFRIVNLWPYPDATVEKSVPTLSVTNRLYVKKEDTTPYVKNIASSDWVSNTTYGYIYVIPFSTHNKGKYTIDGGTAYIPRVRTFIKPNTTSPNLQETYDSPIIDGVKGSVIVTSVSNQPLWVVIE